ncbi:MAG TPA: VWA domain-containing protein, partial [Actinomycetota bacterium]
MRKRTWLVWGLLIAGAASLSAQEPALPGSFGESIDVRVVNVEAVVTDSHGNRVRGLTAGDFRLKVDGKEVPIEFFTEIASGTPAAPVSEARPNAPAEPVPAAPTGAVGRSILVIIDDAFTLAVHRNAVLQGVKKDLAGLRPQDQMAIVAVGLDYQPTVLARWSSDRTVLSAALDSACNRPAGGIDVVATRRSARADEELLKAAAEANDLYLDNASRTAVAEGPPTGVDARLYSQLLKLPTVLVATLHGMAPASGRRVLLLVSGGWPVARVHTPLVVAANRLGYTAYPVGAHGVDTAFAVNDATQTGPSADTARVTSAWQRSVDSGMEFLARMTGGKAFVNSARLDSLARLAEDTNTYYWLGFTPAWKGDDRHHRIEIETVRKDLSVRSRRGFSDLSRASETAVSATGWMLLGGGDPRARKVRIETGQAEGRGKTVRLPVTVAIPVGDLTPIEQAGYWTYQLILSVGVVDSHGGYSNVAEIP